MAVMHVPYGRRQDPELSLLPRRGELPPPPTYHGETYYGMPALKPSPYRWLVTTYFFVGGLASAAQFIATVVDLFGSRRDRPIVRAGRYLALAGALLSPLLLIADLHTPRRWYNMLRIYRRTSPMSIGSWALILFGMSSGAVAAGQAAEDLFGWRIARWGARAASIPAAVAGGIVSLYTGTLLAATNIPMWASAFPYLSSLFASSAASTATAALTLAAQRAGVAEESRRRLSTLGAVTSATELLIAARVWIHWHRSRTGAPLRDQPIRTAWRAGVLGLGIAMPLAVHLAEAARGCLPRRWSNVAAIATLVGGFLMRAVFIFGGVRSAERPEDYFRMTDPSRVP